MMRRGPPTKTNSRFDALKPSGDDNQFRSSGRGFGRSRDNSPAPRRNVGATMPLPKPDDQPVSSTYVTPALRNRRRTSPNRFRAAPKTEPKKEFQITSEAFPTLGGTGDFPPLGATKEPEKTTEDEGKTINFASVAKGEDKPEPVKTIVDDVKPGWVRMRRDPQTREIIMEHGPPTQWQLDEPIRRKREQDRKLREMLERWQADRDAQNEFLGDMSPYWGMKSLLEPSDDEDEYQSGGSYESDQDYDDY